MSTKPLQEFDKPLQVSETSTGQISDARMDELIKRAKAAATRGVGGGDGSSYIEVFSDTVYTATLNALIVNERCLYPANLTSGPSCHRCRRDNSTPKADSTLAIDPCQVCHSNVCEDCSTSGITFSDPEDGEEIHSCDLWICDTPECRKGAEKL